MPRYEERPCADCGKVRSVQMRAGEPISARCHPCGAKVGAEKRRGKNLGPRSSNWRGGRSVMKNGYVMVTLHPDDPFAVMGNLKKHRSVYEHRIVMARHLGRTLTREEQVHHVNGNKTDNRLTNLRLTTLGEHAAYHRREVQHLRSRVQELERELAALKAEAS